MDRWGALTLVAHVVELVPAYAALRELRGSQSHETQDRLVLAGSLLLLGVGAFAWAPRFIDGAPGPAHGLLLLPAVVGLWAALRLRRRRAWLRGLYDSGHQPRWQVVPLGPTPPLGVLPLVDFDGDGEAALVAGGLKRSAYRDADAAVAFVAPPDQVRGNAVTTTLTVSAASMLLVLAVAAQTARTMGIDNSPPMMTSTTFEILSPGAEPRQRLQFTAHVGRCDRAVTDTDEQWSVDGRPAMALPRGHVHQTMVAVRLLPDGNIVQRNTATSVGAVASAETDPGLLERVRWNVAQRSGSQLESEITPSGQSLRITFYPSATVEAATTDEMEQKRRARRGSGAAFPPTPLGLGARWRATRTTTEAGITSVGTFEYTLVGRDGDRVTLEKTLETHATTDFADAPLPPDQRFKLRALDSTGTGTVTLDLQRLLPVSEVVDTEETVSFVLGGVEHGLGEGPHVVSVKRHLETRLDPAPDEQ